MTGKTQNVTPHINKDSTPYSVFMLHFTVVITESVETNWHYQQVLGLLWHWTCSVPNITESEMFLILVIIVHMAHEICDSLKDYWFFTFLDFLTFQTMTMLLTIMTKTMTDYGKLDKNIFTCWTMHIQNITLFLNIWLWMKLQYFSRYRSLSNNT